MMTTGALHRLHKWLGLGLAVWLALAAVTGMVWTLRDLAADAAASNPTPTQCPNDIDSQNWRVTLRAADEQIVRIDSRDDTFRILRVSVIDRNGERRLRHVDQCTGTVVRASDTQEEFIATALWLHGALLPGPVGKQVIGALGITTFALVVIGIWLWWRRGGGSLRTALKVAPSRHGLVRLRSWHRVGGAVTAVLLLLAAPSGVLMAYSSWLIQTPSVGSHCAAAGEIENLDPFLDEALRVAREQVPNGTIRSVRLEGKNCVARVHMQSPSASPSSLVDRVWIDLRSSQVLAHSRSDSAAASHRAWGWAAAVHSGHLFGAAGWLLPLVTGTVLLGLCVTGAWAYFWSKKSRKGQSIAANQR